MEAHITIKRKTEEQDLYVRLQEKALKDTQRYSGEVWTDYNAHDPGVTLLDALNYSLLETDYRLHFGLQDYLTPFEGEFNPARHALFLPSEIFPANPVTETDYRKLFVSNVDDLSDVRVVIHPETGTYDFALDVWPDTPQSRRNQMVDEVKALYHSHRNLCENIGIVRFLEYEMLHFCIEAEIAEAVDETRMMARIFLEVQEFLKAGVRFRRVDELLAGGKTPDEILDGPEQARMVVDETSLCTDWKEYDLSVLYQHIKELPGVVHVASLSFEGNGRRWKNALQKKNDFQGYALFPFGNKAHQMQLTRKGKLVSILEEEVERKLCSLRTNLYGAQNRTTDKQVLDSAPSGEYRNIFTHYPVRHDLPDCYKSTMSASFNDYLSLFDRMQETSLAELKNIPAWMVPDTHGLGEKKAYWLDLLDNLYGENSNPVFFRKQENETERQERRIAFLKDIPLWGLNRGRGLNLLDNSAENESGLETYVKKLLNAEKYAFELFLIEHNLLNYRLDDPDATFHLSMVWSVDEEWLYDDEFRHGCEQLLQERIPAHLHATILWQDRKKVNEFRQIFWVWKYSLAIYKGQVSGQMGDKLKKYLADDNYWYDKI